MPAFCAGRGQAQAHTLIIAYTHGQPAQPTTFGHYLAAAIEVLRKKFKQPAADLAEKHKQMRFLAYRGFDMDIIQTAMKSSWQEDNEADGF